MRPTVCGHGRAGRIAVTGLVAALALTTLDLTARAASRSIDPAQVVPLDKIAPEARATVTEVIGENTLHCKGSPETFPCNSKIYLSLLNEPALTLSLWQDLSNSSVRLTQIGPNRYQGDDGAGTKGVWEFVYRSPKMHVLLCNLNYTTPRGNARLDARIVLIVHSGFYREINGESWVQHDIEAFVKVDSKGWKALARTVRPIIEKVLDDQVREAGWFVSLMGRLVTLYPTWAVQVAAKRNDIPSETRTNFRDLVLQTRRPGASNGRPTLAENTDASVRTR